MQKEISNSLCKYRSTHSRQCTEGRHSALDICYKDDIKKYGDPAVSGFSSGELDSSTDNWVRTINNLVPCIKPNSHGVKCTHDQDDDNGE